MCDIIGCPALGRWRVGFRLWALEMPVEKRNAGNGIDIQTGVVVCDEHKERPMSPPEEFFAYNGRRAIETMCYEVGRAKPDLDHIEYLWTLVVNGHAHVH